MKIIVFSLGVVFPDNVQGGSQKVLRELSIQLGKRGHFITIYCPQREDNYEEFYITEHVLVKPILPLGGAFPMPYNVSPFDLFETSRILLDEVNKFDLLYCHDGGLCIELVKKKIPTVISLRDFCYPETLLGALNFDQAAIIVNSDYTYRCLHDTFSLVNPRIKRNVSLIYNGYDTCLYSRKQLNDDVLKSMKLPEKKDCFVVGFPHRPQMDKGIANAIKVITKIKVQHPNIRLLVPLYMDINMSFRTDATYSYIYKQIEEQNLHEQIVFHPWIDQQHMSYYYSYCDVVLNIGDFVESFSNVAVESLLCETLVIAFNIVTYRTMPIKKHIKVVDYGDLDAVSEIILNMIASKAVGSYDYESFKRARTDIVETFNLEKSINQYEMVFENAVRTNTAPTTFVPVLNQNSSENYYRLTAWTSYNKGYFYNEYDKRLYKDELNGFLYSNNAIVAENCLLSNHVSKETIERFIKKGIIMKVIDEF